jgi:lactobin A/cerein 7B family class IIb bacteriocin
VTHINQSNPGMVELSMEEVQDVNGGVIPLIAYFAAVGVGAVIGFAYCAIQGMREARGDN